MDKAGGDDNTRAKIFGCPVRGCEIGGQISGEGGGVKTYSNRMCGMWMKRER